MTEYLLELYICQTTCDVSNVFVSWFMFAGQVECGQYVLCTFLYPRLIFKRLYVYELHVFCIRLLLIITLIAKEVHRSSIIF